ncbi:MAG: RluA family pseudouridine synthase [Acidobacteriota bacterium]|nr:RluA family pseudouridine synthase [Acidobacteriota bacterium]MDH3529902.1 RluA family pseudouridine synthase [Acidobacteriota bacterium]
MGNKLLEFKLDDTEVGVRLDAFLAEHIEGWSRSRLKKLIDEGDVLVNGGAVKSSYKLRDGDSVTAELSETPDERFEPEDIPLDIVFEDDYLAVINKPAGMIVHPGAGVSSGTLANAIAYHFRLETESGAVKSGKTNRVGIVHRLDKDTSGLLIVGKNELTAEKLSAQFHDRKVTKSYVALAHGFVRKLTGKIDQPIARDRNNRTKMAVDKNGRNAVSFYKVRKRFDRFTLLDVDIKTGRTHQIRVHLAHINHPIVGDETYNAGRDKTIQDAKLRSAVSRMGRFFLHAEKLSFAHPVTKQPLEFVQPLPDELVDLLSLISAASS